MRFVNPSKYESFMRRDGARRPEDIWSLFGNEISDERGTEIGGIYGNIDEFLEEEKKDSELVRKIRIFCNLVTREIKKRFLSLLKECKNGGRQVSQRIIDYLVERNLVIPSFEILNGQNASERLKDIGLSDEYVEEGSFVLIFQLPKPMAQFWWKGGAESWSSFGVEVDGMVIEWGYFYREIMPIVWGLQGYYENEVELQFLRVNEIGQHDPKNYYYVWKIYERT